MYTPLHLSEVFSVTFQVYTGLTNKIYSLSITPPFTPLFCSSFSLDTGTNLSHSHLLNGRSSSHLGLVLDGRSEELQGQVVAGQARGHNWGEASQQGAHHLHLPLGQRVLLQQACQQRQKRGQRVLKIVHLFLAPLPITVLHQSREQK